MKITAESFPEWFDEELKKRKLSSHKMAVRSGLNHMSVLRWKKNSNGITLHNLENVARFFGYEIHLVKRGSEESKKLSSSVSVIDEINAKGLKELLVAKEGRIV